MGSQVNTRNSKKHAENSRAEPKPAKQTFGFGISNLTSAEDSKLATKAKSGPKDAKRTPEKGKTSPQLKKAIRKPSPSKKIKSILKSSNSKRSVVEAKPSESMLLLLGGESAKKAQQAKSMLKETTNTQKQATQSAKTKEMKQDLNQKAKQVNKSKQSKVEDTPIGITLVGSRRRDKKKDETMDRLMMLEAAAEKKGKGGTQPESTKNEKNTSKTSPIPSPKPSPATKQPSVPEKEILQTRSSKRSQIFQESQKDVHQKVPQVTVSAPKAQQPTQKPAKTNNVMTKKIAPKVHNSNPSQDRKTSSKIVTSHGLFSNLMADDEDAINMDELIGQSSHEIKPARAKESSAKSPEKKSNNPVSQADLLDEIMNIHSTHLQDQSDEYSYDEAGEEEESANERGEHDGYRSRSRTAEKKVFKIVSQLNKKGRAKKSVEEKIQKAQTENKPVIIQQKLDVPWEQITEVKELLKQNIQQEQEKKRDVQRENQKESVSVAILNALHSVGSKGLFKKIIHYAQENFKEDVVGQIMSELGIRTRKRRERKFEMPLEEMRAIQRFEETHRRHPILEEDYDEPDMLEEEEEEHHYTQNVRAASIKSIGLDINELVTAEVQDSNLQTPSRQKIVKSFHGNNLSNFIEAKDEIDESQPSFLNLTPKSPNAIDFDELSGAKHIPSPQKHIRSAQQTHQHDESVFNTQHASTEKNAEYPVWQSAEVLLAQDYTEEPVQIQENIFESEQEDAMQLEQDQELKQSRDAISSDGQDDFNQNMAEESEKSEGTDFEPVNDVQFERSNFQASSSSIYHTLQNNGHQVSQPVASGSVSANQGFSSPQKSNHNQTPSKQMAEEQPQYSPRLICEPTEEDLQNSHSQSEESRESPEVDDEGDYENELEAPVILEDDERDPQSKHQSEVEESSE